MDRHVATILLARHDRGKTGERRRRTMRTSPLTDVTLMVVVEVDGRETQHFPLKPIPNLTSMWGVKCHCISPNLNQQVSADDYRYWVMRDGERVQVGPTDRFVCGYGNMITLFMTR